MSEHSAFDPAFLPILRRCQPATMTSVFTPSTKRPSILSAAQIASNAVSGAADR